MNKETLGLLALSILPRGRAIVAASLKHQQDVMQVMAVLPGKHRYEQVEAAINASGISPSALYYGLAANDNTIALVRFYEALNGPGGRKL